MKRLYWGRGTQHRLSGRQGFLLVWVPTEWKAHRSSLKKKCRFMNSGISEWMNACFLYEFIRVIHMMHFASKSLVIDIFFARHGRELQTPATLQLMRNFILFIPDDDWYRIIANLCPRWIYIV